MKALVTTLACAGMLMAGVASAQSTSGSSAANANPTHAKTVSHETKAERIATREMCHKAADDRGLTGTARADYMRTCHLQVVAR